MKEQGLYYPNGHFKSDSEIKRKAIMEDMTAPVFKTPLPPQQDFNYWSNRFIDRQKQYEETAKPLQAVEIDLPGKSIINFIGDLHIGAPRCDYIRIKTELETIVNTPNSYVLLMGDAVDGYFFNPAQMEQIEQVPEQFQYAQAVINYLAEYNRLLVAWNGDHDGWSKKMGVNAYHYFAQHAKAYFMNGVGFVTLNVGEQEYKITGAHRLPGFSQYNSNHPQMRAYKFGGAEGSDIVVSGHTHKKQYSVKPESKFGGISQNVHYISVGPYKFGDDYADKLGLSRQSADDLYGSAVILDDKSKHVLYFDDIVRANNFQYN